MQRRRTSGWWVVAATLAFSCGVPAAQAPSGAAPNPFRQLEDLLPTPGAFRSAAGAPGAAYWQQRVDYDIEVTLDDDRQWLTGSQRITYHNNSPDTLAYLWIQLDQNRYRNASYDLLTRIAGADHGPEQGRLSFQELDNLLIAQSHEAGYRITAVKDGRGRDLRHGVVDTMMWVDLAEPLLPSAQAQLRIDWNYHIVDGRAFGARGGYERARNSGAHIYGITEWFPRLAAYTDVGGWQHEPYLGRGEFALELGDYRVAITVPADHIVTATGVLTNATEVLSTAQRERLEQARTAAQPVYVVTAEDAKRRLETRSKGSKTWRFDAPGVRDFAFGASRAFLWEAWGYRQQGDGRTILAQSLYPQEALGLWDKYAVKAVVQALKTFSRYSFDYPYPVAIAAKGPLFDGMEYPMISFNGPMPTEHADGSRSNTPKEQADFQNLLVHETGHFYFPMLVNTNERQWAWMDEGMVSLYQALAMEEWDPGMAAANRKELAQVARQMAREPGQVPIMSDPDSLSTVQSDFSAYSKVKLALYVLRDAVLGHELFDRAFKEYARRWYLKRPEPADFFRTMEDASGVDLDWFWRGWFFSTAHVDVAIDGVKLYRLDPRTRTAGAPLPLSDRQRELSGNAGRFYVIHFTNRGGLPTPLLLDIAYADGSRESLRLPVEIWRYGASELSKLLLRDRQIESITLDPQGITGDAEVANNSFRVGAGEERLELYDAEAEAKKAAEAELTKESGRIQ